MTIGEMESLARQMTGSRLQEMLRPCGALQDVDDEPPMGKERVHFAFDHQSHFGRYYDMQKALQFRSICDFFALLLLLQLPDEIRRNINVVAGPERGVGQLLQGVAHYLPVPEVRTVTLEKVGSGQIKVPPYFKCDPDDRVLLVDDIFRSGRTLEASKRALPGALISAVAVAVNRAPLSWSAERSALTMPIISVIRDPLLTFLKNDCPWCECGIPLVFV
ncbi:MAG: hypothetical protein HYW91_03275 [Candidatus Sungbacteria bacterium]|nr:hypothetical protein [Candidatus Sungbacteria bacterium]